MRYRIVVSIVLMILTASPVLGQTSWGVSPEIGLARFTGHAHSITGAETSGHPSGASTWGVRLDRNASKVRFAVGLLYASMGVVFEDDQITAGIKHALTLFEITPEVSLTAIRLGQGQVRLHGAMVIDRWSPDGDAARTVLGGLGAVSLEAPLSGRIGMVVRFEAGFTGSLFDGNDLPPEFERRQGGRQRLGVGARFRI